MFGVWAFLLGLLLVENLRLDLAMLLGFAVGGAVLTKSPGWFFLLLQPALIFWRPKWQQLDWFKLFGGWLVAAIIAVGMYNILRLGPNFQLVAQRNLDYVFSPNEVLQHPLNPFIGNIKNTLAWLMNLITPVGLILAFASILGRERKQVSLWVWIILPLLAQAAVAKVYTSRYFFYVIPYLAILAALGWRELQQRQRTLAVFLAALFISQCLVYGWTMVTNPARARMPQNMAHGYLQEWTAGWGQKEVADYLIERAKTHTVVVGTEGFFGTLPDGLQIYTEKVPNLTVIGVGLNVSAIPESLKQALVENEVYLVINKDRHSLKEIPPEKRKLLLSFPKPSRPNGSNEELDFYQLFL
ncbi:MAG: hypothetical protein UY08_C0003G0015 [Candidatus Gottesmanbacteria bacterium GW2011_GWA1_47_8]|uniref:Glycosyltransferase RgtA/B/C/D-like domain-containing protein n=1 Tax=Candidatus Gottesmanbacteria bacterium GW2011_GWA1_47_8 TaxID=1618438 RepID=A0A0G1TH02_9BACT|nr:MAG: hypothetical protein UY08_C0003G0015 [Candidatus Gottesmanbacteria bacterium GW2011_GWA1_47_8]